MVKQVKVNVSWTQDEVCLSTDRGVNFYFRKTSRRPSRGTCETIVSGLVSSLIIPTVNAAFYSSDNNEFTFEFTIMDEKES